MLTLLKILLFGGAVLLTPKPIDLVDTTTIIQLTEPISAITENASLTLDIAEYISADNEEAATTEFLKAFPDACVSAMLHSKFGVSVYLDNAEGQWRDGKKLLRLSATTGMDAGINFTRVELHVCKEIRHTTLTWHNYDKPSFLH